MELTTSRVFGTIFYNYRLPTTSNSSKGEVDIPYFRDNQHNTFSSHDGRILSEGSLKAFIKHTCINMALE